MTQSCASLFNDAESVALMFHSFSLFAVFLYLAIWNKQYVHSTYPRLEKHADDGHHRQSSVSKFRAELLGFLSRVGRSQDLESKVACGSRSSRRLVLGNLAEGHVGQDLTPSSKVSILDL